MASPRPTLPGPVAAAASSSRERLRGACTRKLAGSLVGPCASTGESEPRIAVTTAALPLAPALAVSAHPGLS